MTLGHHADRVQNVPFHCQAIELFQIEIDMGEIVIIDRRVLPVPSQVLYDAGPVREEILADGAFQEGIILKDNHTVLHGVPGLALPARSQIVADLLDLFQHFRRHIAPVVFQLSQPPSQRRAAVFPDQTPWRQAVRPERIQ